MGPWEFLAWVSGTWVVGYVLCAVWDRWQRDRARDRRVAEWTQMIREKREREEDWQSRTWREKK